MVWGWCGFSSDEAGWDAAWAATDPTAPANAKRVRLAAPLHVGTGAAESTPAMSKDPVCGMNVDEKKAGGTAVYNGKTYYFCSPGCKVTFEKAPTKYAQK